MDITAELIDSTFSEELYAITPPPAVIFDQPWETITEPERILLEKILAAIKKSLNGVTIQYQAALDLSKWINKPDYVIYFGKPRKGIPLYDAVEPDGVKLVASESLKDLLQNDDARKRLWQALKKQFSIN